MGVQDLRDRGVICSVPVAVLGLGLRGRGVICGIPVTVLGLGLRGVLDWASGVEGSSVMFLSLCWDMASWWPLSP